MACPTTTSLRGQQTKYFAQRSDLADRELIETSYTKDADVLDTSEVEEDATVVKNILTAAFWTIVVSDESICLTYNPLSDHYSIRPGTYVL